MNDEQTKQADASYLKAHCLAKLPLPFESVAALFSRARQAGAAQYCSLAMSHERLRNELTGAEIIINDLRSQLDQRK